MNTISVHNDVFASDTVTIDYRPIAVSEMAAGLHGDSNPGERMRMPKTVNIEWL